MCRVANERRARPAAPASRVLRKVIVTDLFFLSEVSSEALLKVKPELPSAYTDTTSLFFLFRSDGRSGRALVSITSPNAADAGCVLQVTHFYFLLRTQFIKQQILTFTQAGKQVSF